jgi:hypothetical protein
MLINYLPESGLELQSVKVHVISMGLQGHIPHIDMRGFSANNKRILDLARFLRPLAVLLIGGKAIIPRFVL